METEPKKLELKFQTKFRVLNNYLYIAAIIVVVSLLVIFVQNDQVQIWALIAGGVGIIYFISQILKYGQYDEIRFSKTGIFLEKKSSPIPKAIYLFEDIGVLKIMLRQKRIQSDDEDDKKEPPSEKFQNWIDLELTKRNGELVVIDMRLFIPAQESTMVEIAKEIEDFIKKASHLDVETIQDTNTNYI